MQSSSLFVYGSFASGRVHYARLSGFVTEVQSAHTIGSVFRLQVGYPVMVSEGNDRVEGELLLLSASTTLWTLLDEFHGVNSSQPEKSLFWRKTLAVTTARGELLQAESYIINPQKLPKSALYIEQGRWRESLEDQPPMPQMLTERQLRYIQKLGATTGREIVPIELDLYRELMKLDIIVDKGRRLALTRLGKEVYRYLA